MINKMLASVLLLLGFLAAGVLGTDTELLFLWPGAALLGLAAWRRGRRRGAALLWLLLAAQIALGLLNVAAGLPLAGVLLHNLLAALLLATLARLA